MAAPTNPAEAFSKSLANGEPSTHGTYRTGLNFRFELEHWTLLQVSELHCLTRWKPSFKKAFSFRACRARSVHRSVC
jgi:hypothetical protein